MSRPRAALAALLLLACGVPAARAEPPVARTNSAGQADKPLDAPRTGMIGLFVAGSGKPDANTAGLVDAVVVASPRDARPCVRAAVLAIHVRNADPDDLRQPNRFDRSIGHQSHVGAAISPAVFAIVTAPDGHAPQDHAAGLRQQGIAP